MVFSSYEFIFIFLPVTLAIFYILKAYNYLSLAKFFLVCSSLFFYAFWKFEYLFILLSSMLVNFFLANAILKKENQTKQILFFLGIAFNLLLLGFFKYTDFLLENFNTFSQIIKLDFNIPLPHILLPLAISFFTFQQIAFLVDCYKRKNIEDLKVKNSYKIDLLDYSLFITFFPQLIAGPIVHHKEMMPQFHILNKEKSLINWEYVAKGLFIFSIGLFKKVFIADSFAVWANAGFKLAENGGVLNIFEAWGTSLAYTFQLYFDFSGYCDMAIGLGLFFGVILPINFNSPYKALNIADFWRRWHITLGKFLRDYLYIPLGGNRVGRIINLRNLFLVALLSGIWHGAGWGFIIWGILHATAMVIHRIYSFWSNGKKFLNSKIYKIFAWFITFNFINIAWVFFRSENLSGAISILKAMFGITWVELPIKWHLTRALLERIQGSNETLFFTIITFILCLYCNNSIQMLNNFKPNIKNSIITMLLLYIAILTLISVPYTEFIYFNF
ncbi:MBOAT family protein [Campylobacter coli]|nr:MBOAT family protein [Campylobacter coli]ECR3230016.1 MBOAT family protein [Campylobacter coli]